MVNPNANTPNRKRKSLAGEVTPTPNKNPKQTEKTPGKNKNTPGNPNKGPKATPGKPAGTPKPTPGKQNNTPKPGQFVKTPKPTPGNKNKKTSESESDAASPKKLQKFSGTSELGQKKQPGEGKKKKSKRGFQFPSIKQKLESGDKDVIKSIEEKIKSFESRKELTKTAKRKLKLLQKLKREALGEKVTPPTTSQKRRERKQNAKAKHTAEKAKPTQGKQQKQAKKTEVVKKPTQEDEESDEESSEYEVETEIKPGSLIKTKEQEEESGEEEEESGEDEAVSGEEEEESGEEEEDEVEGEEDDDSDEEESDEIEEIVEKKAELIKQGKKPQNKQVGSQPDLATLKESNIMSKKQSRYVLFVGNLPFDVTREDITEHFKKAGEIRDIRIILDKHTKKPRGFAYVEFYDEIAFQKCLSLHHTSIKGRRINVLYTAGGKKKGEVKKNEIKVKNLKLHALRKQGQLAGSVKQNQKRSARRAKQNAAKVNGSNS